MNHQLRQPNVEGVDEHGTTMLEEDESTSIAINYERMTRDLSNDRIEPAFCVDPNEKVSKYLLFKVAAQIVKAYPPWKKYVFECKDIKRRQNMRQGMRHDVQGSGHPVVVCGPNDDDFELDQGLPVTVKDEDVRRHFQAKHEANTSKYDGDEMLRRYRFSVVITKLTEALYRLGYDVEGSFGTRVRTVNKVEDREGVDALTVGDYQTAQGHVASAMKEAIRIAFKCATYSFFSANRSREQYRFDMADFQSYTYGKSQSKDIRNELIHILHYYNLITVPVFKELVDERAEKTVDRPLVLKYIQDTPLNRVRGINALMPIDAGTAAAGTDVNMTPTAVGETPVIEVEDFPAPEFASSSSKKPPPPDAPLIEDVPMDEATENPGITSTTGAYVETIGEIGKAEQVGSAPWKASSTPTPVTLTPFDRVAREDTGRTKSSYVEPTPKPMSQAPKANLVPRERRSEKGKTEVKEEPKPERGTSSSSVPATFMTHEVRSVPQKKSKTETTDTTHMGTSDATSSADATVQSGNVNTATDTAPSAPADEMWKGYTPTTTATTEASTAIPKTHNTPRPPAPSRLRYQQDADGSQQAQSETGGKGGKTFSQQKGRPEGKGVWRPRLDQSSTDQPVQDPDRARSRFAPTGTVEAGKQNEGKSFQEGKTKSKGRSIGSGKDSGQGKSWQKGWGKRHHDATIEYIGTGVYGPEGAVWHILQANYPDQFNNAMTEFWQDEDSGEWYVRWRYEWIFYIALFDTWEWDLELRIR